MEKVLFTINIGRIKINSLFQTLFIMIMFLALNSLLFYQFLEEREVDFLYEIDCQCISGFSYD